jgi:hypothetical protein
VGELTDEESPVFNSALKSVVNCKLRVSMVIAQFFLQIVLRPFVAVIPTLNKINQAVALRSGYDIKKAAQNG